MPNEFDFPNLKGHYIEADKNFVPRPSPFADALEKITHEDLQKYPNQVVAISVEEQKIIAGADTLEELAVAVMQSHGEDHTYLVACGAPQT